MHKPSLTATGALLLVALGCSDDAAAPAAPNSTAKPHADLPALARTASTSKTRYRIQEMAAEATFYNVDPSGCVDTYMDVFGADSAIKEGAGKPTGGPLADIRIYRTNFCTGETLREIVVPTGDSELRVDATFEANRNLADAHLRAEIRAFDYATWTEVPVNIDLVWTGEGSRVFGSYRVRGSSPGLGVTTQFFKGVSREALASGTVQVDNENLAAGGSVDGDIERISQGEREILRTR